MFGYSVELIACGYTDPYPDHGKGLMLLEAETDAVVLALGEGSQPQVHVIPGPIHTVQQVPDYARVLVVLWQHVDICRLRCNLRNISGITDFILSIKVKSRLYS